MNKFKLFLIAFLIACGGGGEAVTPPGIRVKPSSLPAAKTGQSTQNISNCTGTGGADCDPGAAGTTGAFRTFCLPSHYGYDDPILNAAGAGTNLSHLHVFWGSTTTDYNTDITVAPQTSGGNTSCRGGTLNRSRYWAPALIDTRTGAVIAPTLIHVYYKHDEQLDASEAASIQVVPSGLRMITGNAAATSAQSGGIMEWQCIDAGQSGHAKNDLLLASQADCYAGGEIWMTVSFGSCLTTTLGVPDVDSANHKSHHTRPVAGVCPANAPYTIPRISQNIVYTVPTPVTDLKYYRLSCDTYTGPGGFCGHADFRYGWDDNLHQAWIFGCLNDKKNCQSHMAGCKDHTNATITCRQLTCNGDISC